MKTLKARVRGVLESQPYRMKGKSGDQSKNTIINFWRMRVSYLGPETLYEVELREPLKSSASKKYTVGLNGLAEFEMFSEPHVAAGDANLWAAPAYLRKPPLLNWAITPRSATRPRSRVWKVKFTPSAVAFRSMHTNPEKKSSKEADWRYCHKLCIGDGRILIEMIG